MYEIRMNNGSYFWAPSQPTQLLSETPPRWVQLGTAAGVGPQPSHEALRRKARDQIKKGQIATTFLNPESVSQILDLG